MQSRVVVVGVLVLIIAGVAAVAFWLLSETSGTSTGALDVDVSHTEPAELARLARETEEAPTADELQPSEEDADDAAPTEPTKPIESPAIVRGRCIAQETGLPLAGCTVKFSGSPSNSQKMALHGPVDWKAPEPVVTEADGVFEIEFEAMPPYQHSLDIQAEGRVPRTGRWGAFAPDQIEDLGDIPISRGANVQGQVVDTRGFPVEKVGVSIQNLPLPVRNDMAANSSRSGWSEADGRFTVSTPIPFGTWPLRVNGRRSGYRHVSPDSLTIEEGAAAIDLEVVVEQLQSISGRVQDENGNPLESRIYLGSSAGSTWTREDSTFLLYGSGDPVIFKCERPELYEPLEDDRAFEWGTTDIVLTMRRALSFELTVVDADTRQPIEDYAVQCFAKRARWSSNREPRHGGHHPGGKVTVDGVWRGECVLRVVPKDAKYWFSDVIEFEAADPGIDPMTVELAPLLPVVVRVETPSGTPVVGTLVELIDSPSESISGREYIRKRTQNIDAFFDRQGQGGVMVMSEGHTDAEGRVTLARRPQVDLFAVRALGPGHLPAVFVKQLAPPPGQPLEVTVSAGATLKGRLLGSGYREYPGECSLALVSPEVRITGRDAIPIGPEGEFERTDLPPGSFEVFLRTLIHMKSDGGGSRSSIDLAPSLGQVVLEEGSVTEVSFDTGLLQSATLTGRVLVDGQAPAGARVTLQGRGFSCGQYVPDPEGAFLAEGLPPGSYTLSLSVNASEASRPLQYHSGDSITLDAGARLEHTFQLDHRVFRVRLLEEDGETPASETPCSWMTGDWWHEAETDGQGWLKIEPAPLGPIHLQVRGKRFGPFEMPDGETEATIDVRVSPKNSDGR